MKEKRFEKVIFVLSITFLVGLILYGAIWGIGSIYKRATYYNDGYRVIDTNGELVSDVILRDATNFNSSGVGIRFAHRLNGMYGVKEIEASFIDVQGNEVYPEASEVLKNISFHSSDSYYIGDEVFILAEEARNGEKPNIHIIFLESGEYYVVENVKPVRGAQFFSEELLAAVDCSTNKCGFIDKYGQWVIEPRFSYAYDFAESLAAVKEDDLWGYIDHQGNYVIEPKFEDAGCFSEGFTFVAYEKSKYGFIDTNGNNVIEPIFNKAGSFSEGLACVKDTSTDKFGYINTKGDVVIDYQFGLAYGFVNGLAIVMDSETEKYGYIDTEGKLVIPYQFEYANEFTEDGLASVYCGGDSSETYIDREGKFLFKPQFDYAYDFTNGYACVYLDSDQRIDYSGVEQTSAKKIYAFKASIFNFFYKLYTYRNVIFAIPGTILIVLISGLSLVFIKKQDK